MNKGPWYNTAIYSRLHRSVFEYFITHVITNRYNILCSLFSHDKKLPAYEYGKSSSVDSLIPKHITIESLESLGDTLNFI